MVARLLSEVAIDMAKIVEEGDPKQIGSGLRDGGQKKVIGTWHTGRHRNVVLL